VTGKSACLPCHRFILPCGKTREPFSLAHEIERPGAVADDAGTVSRNLVSSTLSQSGVNEYWLTAARKGRISGRNEPNRTQSCDFWAQKPPIFAQNGTRKSPLIMFRRRELMMLALGAAAQAYAWKTTNILTYMDFTKRNQFSPDVKERLPGRANQLAEERRVISPNSRRGVHRGAS
jgi:hypothetical protein